MMPLFSRGKRDRGRPSDTSEQPESQPAGPAVEDQVPDAAPAVPVETDAAGTGAEAPGHVDTTADAASVGISVSAYRGVGAPAPRPAPQAAPQAPPQPSRAPARETAPPSTETLPGLRDNVLLAEALSALDNPPTPPQILEVARQLLQGQLILRVKGDARSLLAQGAQPPLAVATLGDETFVLVFSGGSALSESVKRDGDTDTSAMGQSALAILRYVLAGPHAGIVIDPASAPRSAVLRRPMLEKIFEGIDPELTIKSLLVSERTQATAAGVAEALARVQFWVAVRRVGESDRLGVAEARTREGERYLEVYSHPLEVVALGRGDQPAPMTGEQLGKALASDPELTGVLVDPAGPWIKLARTDLAGIIPA
jgi:hypothetical protein